MRAKLSLLVIFARGPSLALAIALAIAVLCATSVAAQEGTRKRVMMLFTNQSFHPAQVILEQSMRSALENASPVPLEIYSEYLDAVRTPVTDYEKELVVQFQQKYADKKFDLIFAVNPPALKLLLKNRAVLFPDSPIVFLVLDQQSLEGLNLGANVTGIWSETNYRENLDLALELHPGTKKVIVISGVSEWDNYWRSRVRAEFRTLESNVEFTYLVGLSVAEQKMALANLPPHTIVFFVSSVQDNAGNSYSNVEVLREIGPASNAPLYGATDAHLGLGIIGGRLTSFEAFGTAGAKLGLRVLAGEKPESIAPYAIPGVPMFDWRELKRWGINEASLPIGSIVRFKQRSLWELYRGRIIGVVTLIVLQFSFIALLLFERRQRQRAKDALDQLNAELEQRIAGRTAALASKSRELETFAYSVAHDLKAPLRGIDGYSRLLLEDHADKLDDEGRSFVNTIHSSTQEMGQLIEDLLDYSRLERREPASKRVELHDLVAAVVAQKERELAERQIDMVVNVNGGSVLGDVNSLTQALNNYIDNAIKFTCQVERPRIEVGSEDTTKTCLLWVRDNGVGFDMKYKDRIFEIFQRLNRSEEYPGTGIGLAIVRKAMERMGGRAWAESEPGKGATFYLEIPKTDELNQ